MIFNRTHKTADNRGMSLVEVLVALAIFGIIVGPVCYSFVTTLHINNVSRQIEEATAAGSNLMEDLKELDFNLIEKELSVSDINTEAGDTTASKTATVLGRSYDLTINTEGVYTLTSTETVNKKDYLVRLSMSPKFEANPQPENKKYTNYNERELANLYSMSTTMDGLLTVGSTLDDATAALFGGNILDIEAAMTRTITLNIDKDGDETSVLATVDYAYNGNTETPLTDQPVYNNKDPEVSLRNIYVFFNPLYNKGTGGEKIVIKNPNSIPVNVLLIRLGESSAAKDLKHRVELEIVEPGTKYVTEVKTNLDRSQVLSVDGTTLSKLTLAGLGDEKTDLIAYSVTAQVYLKKEVVDAEGNVIETELTERNRQAIIEGYKEKY